MIPPSPEKNLWIRAWPLFFPRDTNVSRDESSLSKWSVNMYLLYQRKVHFQQRKNDFELSDIERSEFEIAKEL